MVNLYLCVQWTVKTVNCCSDSVLLSKKITKIKQSTINYLMIIWRLMLAVPQAYWLVFAVTPPLKLFV